MANNENVNVGLKVNANSAISAIKKLTSTLKGATEPTKKATEATRKFGESMGEDSIHAFRYRKALKDAEKGTKKFGESAKNATKFFNKLWLSLKRIAWYRTLRWALSHIVKGVKEGVSNFYAWSNELRGDFAGGVNALANSWIYLKNQLGASLGTLLNAVTRQLSGVIDKVAEAITWFSKFFAFITGQNYYYEAVKGATVGFTEAEDDAKDATKAVKEFQKQLMRFDEINNLTKPSDSGSGSSKKDGSDSGSAYDFVKKKLGDWGQDSSMLLTIKDVLFTWGGNLTKEQIAEKVVTFLFTALGTAIGFIVGGAGGALIGATIGTALGLAISSFTFNHDGKVNAHEVATMIFGLLGGIAGAVLLSETGPLGMLIGFTLGASISMLLADVVFKGERGEKFDKWWKKVKKAWGKKTLAIKTAVTGMTDTFKTLLKLLTGKEVTLKNGKTYSLKFRLKLLGRIDDFKEIWENIKTQWEETGPHKLSVGVVVQAFKITFEAVKEQWEKNHPVLTFALQTAKGCKPKDVWKGFQDGWKSRTRKVYLRIGLVKHALSNLWTTIKNFFSNKTVVTKIKSTGQTIADTVKSKVGKNAGGGTVNTGQLFIAREAGPEMVGMMGNQTSVANNQQIIDGIASGVYRAMSAVNANKGDNNVYVTLEGDAKGLFKAVQKEAKSYSAQTGNFAFG